MLTLALRGRESYLEKKKVFGAYASPDMNRKKNDKNGDRNVFACFDHTHTCMHTHTLTKLPALVNTILRNLSDLAFCLKPE